MSGRIINVRSFAFLKTNELAAPTHSESHSPTDAKNPQTKESTGSKNWRKGCPSGHKSSQDSDLAGFFYFVLIGLHSSVLLLLRVVARRCLIVSECAKEVVQTVVQEGSCATRNFSRTT